MPQQRLLWEYRLAHGRVRCRQVQSHQLRLHRVYHVPGHLPLVRRVRADGSQVNFNVQFLVCQLCVDTVLRPGGIGGAHGIEQRRRKGRKGMAGAGFEREGGVVAGSAAAGCCCGCCRGGGGAWAAATEIRNMPRSMAGD